jgi:hypothetical protein
MTCIILPGSADICFVTETSMQQVIGHLNFHKITILAGPAERDGATGPLTVNLYSRPGW